MSDTPTDDERTRIEQSNDIAEIVFAEVKKAWPDLHPVLSLRYGIADALWAAGFRRSEVPESSSDDPMSHYTDPTDPFWQPSPEPQGEPSDAQVEAAAREYHERGNGEGSFDRMADHVRTSLLFRMRAALRAAGGAR
ncbi:hypothetical protein QEH45_gp42 [Microbacterium phage Shocker]|uniref:Uncharacterized protein n=1 Tax=Microbacterium phage Shocker TaxID=2805839 RepID=A0A890URJ6_9CAUD|nr:hypothetical protein QEH45_gp42 [Microbacterium phage Shocker]QRI45096.1 hypothetical protein SEA_SHOCKER_42 [Microbacterium phage Shocker]